MSAFNVSTLQAQHRVHAMTQSDSAQGSASTLDIDSALKFTLQECSALSVFTRSHANAQLPVYNSLCRVDKSNILESALVGACRNPTQVSLLHAGVIQPTKEIGKMCRERKVFFHTDAAQAVGKIPINVNDHNIDLMSISGHKIYGPKGVGAIYIRRRPRVRLEAQMNGGGQVSICRVTFRFWPQVQLAA